MKSKIVLTAIAAAAVMATGAASAQTTILKFTHYMGSNHSYQTNIIEPWCAEVEKESAGRMKCQIYPSLQLGGTAAQLPDLVKNGVADIAWIAPVFSTGRFPRTEALELPFVLPASSLGGALAMWEFTQKYGMEDYKDFKLLSVWSATGAIISTASKPVIVPEDMKGLKLRSPSRYASLFLSALGAVPVNMAPAQITESIAKGVIDGALAPWEPLPSIKVDEVTKYHIEGPARQTGMTQVPFALVMNKQKYESLPADLKAVIDRRSGLNLVERSARMWELSNESARKKIIAQGNKVLVIKDADFEAMKKTAAPVEAEWIKQANAKGLPGEKLMAEVKAIGKKYMSQ